MMEGWQWEAVPPPGFPVPDQTALRTILLRNFRPPTASDDAELQLFQRICSQEVQNIWHRPITDLPGLSSFPCPAHFEEDDDFPEIKLDFDLPEFQLTLDDSDENTQIVSEPPVTPEVIESESEPQSGHDTRPHLLAKSDVEDDQPLLVGTGPPPILEIVGTQYRSFKDLVKDSILHDLPPESDRTYICVFCKGNNEPQSVYTSHAIRIDGLVTCPFLRNHVCQLCKATGTEAHTIKYCLKNRRGFFAAKAREKECQLELDPEETEMEVSSTVGKWKESKVKKRGGKDEARTNNEQIETDVNIASEAVQIRIQHRRKQKRCRTRHATPPRFKKTASC